MAISSGTRLGPYKTVAVLGTVGMGDVYRKRDLWQRSAAVGAARRRVLAGDWRRRTAKHSLRYSVRPHGKTVSTIHIKRWLDFVRPNNCPSDLPR
jgi:hypothetical protein